MAKIKIDVPGWELFTGYLGTVDFVNGVSTREVSPTEVRVIGANIRVVEVDSDEQVGPATSMVNARHVSATVEAALETESAEPEVEVEGKYNEDNLNAMADKGGIKALREVAKEFGVKGVSIQELIKEILEAQKKAA